MKKYQIILLIVCLILNLHYAYALEGGVEYSDVHIDYDLIKEGDFLKLADTYLYKAENESETDVQKRHNYREALGYYLTVIQINPESINTYGKIGYIYHRMNRYLLARSYFNRGLLMQPENAYLNFLFGSFFFDHENYNRALECYKKAKRYNYADRYSLYYNIGETNEKLGDLVKAIENYKTAYNINKSEELRIKIEALEALQYENSPYYKRKKPFYYND